MLKKFNDLSIARKLTVSFGCILAVTLIVSGFLIVQTLSLRASVTSNSNAVAALRALQTYQDKIEDSQKTMASLITSGDIAYAKAYEASLAPADEAYETLVAQAKQAKGASTSDQIAAIHDAFGEWQASIATKQLEYLQDPYTVDLARFLQASSDNADLGAKLQANFAELETIYAGIQTKRSQTQADMLTMMQIAAVGSGIVLAAMAVFLATFLSRLIAQPLILLADITNKLKDKNWNVEIRGKSRKDEIGDMLRALEVFRQNGVEHERLETAQHLEAEKKLARAQEIQSAIDAFRTKVAELLSNMSGASDKMAGASDQLHSVSSQSAEFTQNVSRAAGATGMSVQSVASAVEEMSASVNEITQQIQNVSTLSFTTAEASNQASDRVAGLQQSAEKINGVIDMITGITSQINLLALNATIESARAGEAGRGFAVVASEVKDLASQAGKATEQITAIIGAIQGDIAHVVETISAICKSVNEVHSNTTAVAAAVEEQGAATNEISTNILRVSNETGHVVDNVTSVQGKVEETRKVATEVRSLSGHLKECATDLNGAITSFIANVAA